MINKTNISVLLSFFFVVAMLFSCDKENSCVKTSGPTTSEFRIITGAFDTVELNNKINLILTQDSVFSIKVEAGANLLPLITTDVIDNQLIIKSDNRCNFLRSYTKPINVYLSVPSLKKINYLGQGNISCTNLLTFPTFTIEANKATGSVNLALVNDDLRVMQHIGPADFNFIGSSKRAYLYTNGNGWLHFENFICNDAQVNSSGTGDIILNATNSLLVELYAIGNVYYYGNPMLTVSNHTGSGEIKKK